MNLNTISIHYITSQIVNEKCTGVVHHASLRVPQAKLGIGDQWSIKLPLGKLIGKHNYHKKKQTNQIDFRPNELEKLFRDV